LLARALRRGGKVLAFGNGGSATDARDLAEDLLSPPLAGWRALPAIDLTRDYAMLTAVGNDVGFDKVFARQLIAYGAAGDVAVGFSTSGESPNVIEAFVQARRQGLATIGFAGDRGGRMAAPGLVDVAIVAPSPHNTRIQEAHASACHTLLAMLQALLEDPAHEIHR
jgi:D-sedoheptulose 7-phosphate isomerase